MKLKLTVASLALVLALAPPTQAQRFAGILEKLDGLESRLSELEAAPRPAGVDISEQQASIAVLEERVTELQERDTGTEIRGSVVELDERVKTLGDELTAVTQQTTLRNGLLTVELRDLVGSLRETIAASAQVAPAPEPMVPIEISGFGDVAYTSQEKRFETGQVEVDLGADIDERASVEAAIALEEEGFGLGAFAVDLHLAGPGEGSFWVAENIEAAGVVVGQFDVPFGIDWQVYPSVDRKLVSGPIAVQNTHDGWNDYGIQGYLETDQVSAVAYVTNGFGYENAEGAEMGMKMATGGRVGVRVHPQVTVGGSYAGFVNEDNALDATLTGIDVQASTGRVSAKAEYIVQKLGVAGHDEVTHTGFYGQGTYDLVTHFLVARYGRYEADGGSAATRLSLGGGWRVLEGCELRIERQLNSDDEDNLFLLQLVVGY